MCRINQERKMKTDDNPLADEGDFLRCDCGCSRSWRRAGVKPVDRGNGIEVIGRCLACNPLPRWLPAGHVIEVFQFPLSDPAQRYTTTADLVVIETINA
jgi:hypothetical protein